MTDYETIRKKQEVYLDLLFFKMLTWIYSAGTKSNATPLIQCLKPVGLGPSSKT